MERNPLWIGEVGIVRAAFGHAANVERDRLLRIVPWGPTGRVIDVALEERIGHRRLDVLATFGNERDQDSQLLVVEAKVGAVVDFDTLAEYLTSVQARGGMATGLLVAPYQPVGQLPEGWYHQDLQDVAGQLRCATSDEASLCAVCEEIGYAISATVASDRVGEWRALIWAARRADIPDGWVVRGSGSSVGRPLVWFQSPG